MEALTLFFILGSYIGVRLLLGHHKTPEMIDRRKFKEGVDLVYKRDYSQALLYFEKTLQKHPNSGLCWSFKAECNLYLNNYYQCIADANRALNIDYRLRDCYMNKGMAFYKLEMIEDALVEFDKAIWHFRERHPETFRYRGLCYDLLGNHEKAAYDFEKALKLGDEESNYYLLQMTYKRNVKKNP
ncbi:MAG: tetratricopeptide repeat protein [Bacteroidota bacterium]